MKTCYLCGATENIDMDHVPPKSFFPKPRPSNLITVPSCKKCNNGFSEDDNEMRAWLSTVIARSPNGSWIFDQKVFPKLLSKDKKLFQKIAKSRAIKFVDMGNGPMPVRVIEWNKEPVQRWMIRCTKAMMATFYPDYDYSQDLFHVGVPYLTPKNVQIVQGLMSMCNRDSRGTGIFDFWHRRTSDQLGWLWIFVFFGNACCVVTHAKQFPKDHPYFDPPPPIL